MRKDLYEDLYQTESNHWWHKAKRSYVVGMIERYVDKNQKTILDVGCGTGKNMEELSALGAVYGIDSSEEALLFCKKRGLKNIQKGFIEKIPFEKNSFDVVCALDVLEHVEDMEAVSEIYRVLKNKGILIFTVPAFSWLWSKWDEILGHKRRYSLKMLHKLFPNDKWVIKKQTFIHTFLVLPTYFIRLIKSKSNKQYSSDFQLMNPSLNLILGFLSHLEQMAVKRYDMPFGTSLLCAIQKK